ncbi:MAG: hypothetical protein KJO90_00500 [Eudoraea sp.]|nr:hypothetical protein [Eudoraea sp.]
MIRLSSILLAFLVLLQSSFWDMDDVSRMGSLIEHAKFHADAYGDNFLVFLSKHYGELQKEHDREHQEEKSQHESLPYQNHSCVLVVADLSGQDNTYTLQNSIISTNAPQNFHYLENYASLADFEIFEPPRLI